MPPSSPPSKPIPVRLPPDIIERIDAAAELAGTNRAALIRFCAETFAAYVNKRGRAALPPDWPSVLAAMDGRTKEARDATYLNDAPSSEPTPAQQPVNYLDHTNKRARTKRKQ